MINSARFFWQRWLPAIMIIAMGLSVQNSSVTRGLDYWAFDKLGVQFFDSFQTIGLKDIHLDGAGLLNHNVMVGATIESVDGLWVHMVVVDEKARMLVDVSKIQNSRISGDLSPGDRVIVQGIVKTGEKGHYYLVANALHRG